MPRLPIRNVVGIYARLPKSSPSCTLRRLTSSQPEQTKYDSTPGWKGRSPEDHVVHRQDELDVQSQAAQSGMKEHQSGQTGSQGLNRKDEGEFKKKAKQEHPEAPDPVIGMNDERVYHHRAPPCTV